LARRAGVPAGLDGRSGQYANKAGQAAACESPDVTSLISERGRDDGLGLAICIGRNVRVPGLHRTLRQFSVDHDLGIFDAGHDKLVTEAAAAGLVYKPCGAGGGDVGILLGEDDERLDDFVTRLEPWGYQALEARLEPDGVEMEQR
jgi:hypothetical protein